MCEKDSVSLTNIGTFKKTVIKSYQYFSPINGEKKVKDKVIRINFSLSKQLSHKLVESGDK